MTQILTPLLVILMMGFGAFGFFAPRRLLLILHLQPTQSTMGLSEMRASVGGAWIFAGLVALFWNIPAFYVMFGMFSVGAGIGRVVSLLADNPPFRKTLIFAGVELIFGAALMLLNWTI